MTPREFLEIVVEPNLADFHANCADLRRAHNAVAAVDALAAHIFVWAKRNVSLGQIRDDTEYREWLTTRDADFRLLRDIAKAQKHVVLSRGDPLLKAADQVSSRSIGYGEGPYGGGRWGGSAQVVVDLSAGRIIYLESLLDRALSFLATEMKLHAA